MEFNTNWNQDEFKAYLFIYCAHADFVESKEEISKIKSSIHNADFDKIHAEFDNDNDYQQIQKITHNVKKFYKTQADMDSLFAEVKSLMLADGRLDILEENLFRELKRQLNLDNL